jgi:hypothetical protein
MSQQQPIPSDQERKAFLEKLGQFRGSLAQNEQRMLDAMAAAAFQPQQGQGDVQGYGWVLTAYGYQWVQPTFYQTGWQYQWQATPWGVAWQAVPAGVWTP